MSKGIDIPIDSLVTRFGSELWTTKTNVFKGRIQRTLRNEQVIPEWFNKTTGDYEEVLLNDTVASTSFFDIQPSESYSGYYVSSVWICFSVDLKVIYPTEYASIGRKVTEYIHEDVLNVIERDKRFNVTGLVRGLSAFSDYGSVKHTDNMNEKYLFRFECEIKYPINC